jgi:hypothetical protein
MKKKRKRKETPEENGEIEGIPTMKRKNKNNCLLEKNDVGLYFIHFYGIN